jgi:ABC-2 type transport system permease protein
MSHRIRTFAALLRAEWRTQTRQLTFAAAVAGMGFMGFTLVVTGFGPNEVNVNSPYVVMESLGLLSLIAVFVLTVFCASAALREFEHGMTEIVFATPVGKGEFLLARFAGVVLAAFAVMSVMTALMAVLPFIVPADDGRVGPFRALPYLWALGTVVLPNLLLVAALLFAVALLSRSAIATYVGGVAIYGLYWVTAMMVDSPIMAGAAPATPDALARAAILDPLGLSAFFEQTRYWTPEERDLRLTALTGHFLLNRLLWIGVACAALGVAWRWFALRVGEGGGTRSTPKADGTSRPMHPYRPVAPVRQGGGGTAFLRAVRFEVGHLFRGWTFAAFLVLWIFVAGMESFGQLGGGEYGTDVLATASILFDALHLPILLLGSVAVVYYGAEVAWRERVLGVDPLVDATPTSTLVFYGAKVAALALLPLVMAVAAVLIACVVQLLFGVPVQLGAHLTLLWFGAVPVMLLGVGVLALQALTPNRWVGMLAGLALAIVAQQGDAFGLGHPMLRFTAFPAIARSEMDGFGPAPLSFAAFAGYWASAAFLLGTLSWGIWRRGVDGGLRARIVAVRLAWGRGGVVTVGVSAVLFLASAVGLWVVTERNAPWETGAERLAWRADYERSYRRLSGIPQPVVTDVITRVDLEPRKRRARIAATYQLENRTGSPIDTIWVAVPRGSSIDTLLLDGQRAVAVDDMHQFYGFAVAAPMRPGAQRALRFVGRVEQGGVRASDPEYDVTANGSYLTSRGNYPSIGYRRGYEIGDPGLRREAGLEGDATIPNGERDPWWTVDAIVSTDPDQTALVGGELRESWDSGGRRLFHYVSEGEVTPNFGIASARYAVRSEQHGATRLEVWYDPDHEANVERIVTAATVTLDLLEARLGRYPGSVLRIAEVPAWSGFGGFAHAGLILFTEDRGFLAVPDERDVDLVTRRVAHEVAHQWWGHVVDPPVGPGSTVIVETLAKYSEQLVIAQLHGDSALPAMLRFEEDRYLGGRAEEGEREPALVATAGEAYLFYGKGALAMNALAATLGRAPIDTALARLVRRESGPNGGGTAEELVAGLLAVAPAPADRALVEEWFRARVVDDFKVDSATVRSTGSGQYVAEVLVSGGEGRSAEWTIYGGEPGTPTVIATGRVRLGTGPARLSVPTTERPRIIVLDPSIRRIDLDRSNNEGTFQGL